MKHAINRNNKDSLFRFLFSGKEELLGLYNAVRGTNYKNVEELEVKTLENVIYLGMKNDISFVIGGSLALYEHQSTWNGNIPLRNLIYISNLYSGMTAQNNIYGSATLALPRPEFVVFYNGVASLPDRSVQKLSEAYDMSSEEINLELKVIVLNINMGHNQELMDKCRTLWEYSYYVEQVRIYSKEMPIEEAVEKAILVCIESDVLADFLRTHRMEVKSVSIFEYDAERHIAMEKEESHAEGHAEGHAEERVDLIRKNLGKNLSVDIIADFLEEDAIYVERIKDLLEQYPEESNQEIGKKLL